MTPNHDLWGDALPPEQPPAPTRSAKPDRNTNPCLALYGPGPEAAWCRSCRHLQRLHYHDATYRKCALRTLTHGAGSDHKASWPACARYEVVPDTSTLQVIKPAARERRPS